MPGIQLIGALRARRPGIAILYIANLGRSTADIEADLPANVPILREVFTAQQLRAAVWQLTGPGRDGRPSMTT